MNGIATVTSAWIIKVDNVELRQHLIAGLVCQHVVVGNCTEVTELVVVDIHRKTLFNGLLDKVVHHSV